MELTVEPCLSIPVKAVALTVEFSPYEWSQDLLAVGHSSSVAVYAFNFKEYKNDDKNSNSIHFELIWKCHISKEPVCLSWSPLSTLRSIDKCLQLLIGTTAYSVIELTSDLKKDSIVKEVSEHKDNINSITYSGDNGELLAASTGDDLMLKVWHCKTNELVSKFLLTSPGMSVKFHPEDPDLLLVGERCGILRLYSLSKNYAKIALRNPTILSADWSLADPYLLVASGPQGVFMWNLSEQQPSRSLVKVGGGECVSKVAVCPSTSEIAATISVPNTLRDWKFDLAPGKVSSKGMIYAKFETPMVQCVFCGHCVYFKEDVENLEHHIDYGHRSECPFKNGHPTGNVPFPLNESVESNELMVYNFLEDYLRERRSKNYPIKGNMPYIGSNFIEKLLNSPEKRLATFEGWPLDMLPNLSKSTLVDAGFIYTGMSDFVVCFRCGGGLYNWTENDSPIELHLKYYPDCPFLEEDSKNYPSASKKDKDIRDLTENEKNILMLHPIAQFMFKIISPKDVVKENLIKYVKKYGVMPVTVGKAIAFMQGRGEEYDVQYQLNLGIRRKDMMRWKALMDMHTSEVLLKETIASTKYNHLQPKYRNSSFSSNNSEISETGRSRALALLDDDNVEKDDDNNGKDDAGDETDGNKMAKPFTQKLKIGDQRYSKLDKATASSSDSDGSPSIIHVQKSPEKYSSTEDKDLSVPLTEQASLSVSPEGSISIPPSLEDKSEFPSTAEDESESLSIPIVDKNSESMSNLIMDNESIKEYSESLSSAAPLKDLEQSKMVPKVGDNLRSEIPIDLAKEEEIPDNPSGSPMLVD